MRRTMVFAMLACSLVLTSCEVETTDPDTDVTLADMAIADNDIQGWTISSEETYASVEELSRGAFNGEAFYYTQELQLDLTQASGQFLDGASGRSVDVFVLEFLTPADAQTAYALRKDNQANSGLTPVDVTGFDGTVACLFQASDFFLYAYFDRFLIKMNLNGMADASDADAVAASFLGFFDAKAN